MGSTSERRQLSAHSKKNAETKKLEQLVIGASEGDNGALVELCSVIARDVLFRATRILYNPHDAEDVAQEAMIRICNNISQIKEPKAFGKWVGNIVVNEARRLMIRTAKDGVIVDLTDGMHDIPERKEAFLPEKHVDNNENRKAVIEAIDNLPVRQREAVILYYYDDMNVTETAGIMGIPQSSVSLYLKNARNKIRTTLETAGARAQTDALESKDVPIEIALSRMLGVESKNFTPSSPTWLQDTLDKCK